MNNYRIKWTKSAEKDRTEIGQYIARNLFAPMAAVKTVAAINNAANNLSFMPHKRPIVDDKYWAKLGYRKLNVKNYTIFYVICENSKIVYIKRIIHIRRNWQRALF